jgi:hypothetical protein
MLHSIINVIRIHVYLLTVTQFSDCEFCKSLLGLVLYDHDKVVPFGERLFAAPISTLWR